MRERALRHERYRREGYINMRKRKFYHVFRSAVTGKYVKKQYAWRYPHLCVAERRSNQKCVKRG